MPATLVIGSASAATGRWQDRLDGDGYLRMPQVEPAADGLAEAECALLDGEASPIEQARRLRRVLGDVQLVVVAAPAHHAALKREILFTPGLGEVWVVDPADVDASLVERACSLTQTRRAFRETSGRIAVEISGNEPPTRRAVVSDAYLAALLRAAPDPIVSVSEKGEVVSWNAAAESVLGLRRADAAGRVLLELIRAEDLGPAETDAAGGTRRSLTFRRADGETGYGELIEMPVAWEPQQIRVCILHDQTRSRRAQQNVEQQAAELQALAAELETINSALLERTGELEHALRSRSRFYAAMSHELRTPINAIIGYNALLLDGIFGELTQVQQERLDRAQRAANHLLELVNDVLDLAKIEAGRIELAAEPATFPALIDDLLDTVHSLAEQHGVELEVSGPAEPHSVVTDPRRVRQILLNLLSNAIRFGAGKPVEVRWQGAEDGGVEVHVCDCGPGIDPADMPRIFEEFEQAGQQSGTGTGLGLPISRRLARLLDGDVTVRSKPGVGSRFTLRLPAQLEPRPDERPGATAAPTE